MIHVTNTLKKMKAVALGVVGSLLVISCGSYQATSYGSDGVYGSNSQRVNSSTPRPVANSNSESYFTQKLQEYENAAASEGDVLTDIEGYSSENYQNYDDSQVQYDTNNYEGWGANAQRQSNVQVYANTGWGYNNYYRPYWNRGYRNYNGYWGASSYYGGGYYGWNNPFFYGGYYASGYWGNNYWYGNGFYNYRYNNRYYGNRRYIGNRSNARAAVSRRSYRPRATGLSGRTTSARTSSSARTSRSTSPRSYSSRQSSNSSNQSARRSSSSNSNRIYNSRNSNSSNRSRTYSPRTSRSSGSSARSSSSNRSGRSSSSARSSRSSSSSSGTYRRR